MSQKQKRETTVAILLFTGMLLSNAVIFTIVPALSVANLIPVRAKFTALLGMTPSDQTLNSFQILMVYSIVATLCMLPWAVKQGRKGLKTTRWKHYSLRAVLEYGSYALTLISLSYLGDIFTLPMHTALNFITPMFATAIAILVLKEKAHAHTWLALVVGVIGVLLITRPGMIPLSPGVLYVLGAALGFSSCGVVIKLLCSTESPMKIAFFMLVMTSIFSLPMGILHWTNPAPDGWFWLITVGVLSYASQLLVGKAIAKVPYMMLIPLNFLSLVFSTILSLAVYHKLIDSWTLAGALVILGGALFNTYRNRVHAEREAMIASAA